MRRMSCRMSMPPTFVLLLAACLAAVAPLIARQWTAAATPDDFPGWPTHHEGRALVQLALAPREDAFARDFPGRIGRFTDGHRELVLRWVATSTRRLHPAADCFRGNGYRVTTRPMQLAANGAPMSCFAAHGRNDVFHVCEQMVGIGGGTWPDVSSWYWHALWSGRGRAWWSIVVATPIVTATPEAAVTR